MSFRDRWVLDPFEGRSDLTSVAVQERPGVVLNVTTRVLEDGDGVIQVPESSKTIRIRWREDISALARWIDPYGREWLTDGFVEVGRRKFIDVSVSRFGFLVSGGSGPFVAPDGWVLVDRESPPNPVQELVIDGFVGGRTARVAASSSADAYGLNFKVPAGGWALSANFPLATEVDAGLLPTAPCVRSVASR